MTDYFAKFTANTEDGGFLVSFPDLPEAVTEGRDQADALVQAIDCLESAIFFRLKHGEAIPAPSARRRKGMVAVPLSPLMAAKIAIAEALLESGMTRVALADKLDITEGEVRRILNPQHATKINRIDDALRAMGKKLSIAVEAA